MLILNQADNYLNVAILKANAIPELVVTEKCMSLCHSQTSLKVSDDVAKDHQYLYRMYNNLYKQRLLNRRGLQDVNTLESLLL